MDFHANLTGKHMYGNDPLPTDIEAALFNYDQALARQAKRIELALEVIEGPGPRTPQEILAAANTLLTYGDVIQVQRATHVLRAAMMRRSEEPRAVPVSIWRRMLSLEAFLWALILIGGMYIIAGVFAAMVQHWILSNA